MLNQLRLAGAKKAREIKIAASIRWRLDAGGMLIQAAASIFVHSSVSERVKRFPSLSCPETALPGRVTLSEREDDSEEEERSDDVNR